MKVEKFVSSIYLGDRACQRIIIDSLSHELAIEVDEISRVRADDGMWNFYNDENIENGQLVFGKVKGFFFDGDGRMPNDYINSFDVTGQENGVYCFAMGIGSVSEDDGNYDYDEVILRIFAGSIGLRDPLNPEQLIVD